jgi:hypothetical protein
MALEGTIRDFGLPDIFQLIGLQRKTGLLTLRSDKETVTVTFENGMVVMADSSSKRLEDRLGNVLVKQGKLPKERLDEVLQMQRATLQRLGHILVGNNHITSKDLKDALQTQVAQIVFKVFRWRDGDYHFAPTETVDYDRENFTPMSADFILMEGIRMVDEWPIIEKKIPSMDIVFRTVVDAGMVEIGGAEDGGAEDPLAALGDAKRAPASTASKIRLTSAEERIYRRVDGVRTVQAVIDSTGLAEFEVCRTLFDLLNRNIIAPVGRGAVREQAEGRGAGEAVVSWTPGYVLVAVALALALLGVWRQRAQPFGLTGGAPILTQLDEGLRGWLSSSRLEQVDRAIVAYDLARGSWPSNLDEVVNAGLIERSSLKDAWSRPYRYARTGQGYLLSALDAEGEVIPELRIERARPPEAAR